MAVCTETLAAGINLPARSVVMTSLMKGPFGKEKLIEPSTAHQIFGRAGRPQFDTEGFVFALAHEDDVRILRWKEKFDQIPEDTKDPVLLKKKKELKRKKPERNRQRQYWNEASFERLKAAPPGRLYSKGPLPWRLLAYLLDASPQVSLDSRRDSQATARRAADRRRREANGADAADAARRRLRRSGTDAGQERRGQVPAGLSVGKSRRRRRRLRSCSASAACIRSMARSSSTCLARPTGTNACRRSRACWRCRGRF